jgi:hypothetical protein
MLKYKAKKKIPYDIGMGTHYFHLFVSGQKKAVASIPVSETGRPDDVDVWAKKEYLKWKTRKKLKRVV